MADSVERRLTEDICHLPVEVVCELVYVLSGVYRVERRVIAQTVIGLADMANVRMAKDDVMRYALGVFASSTLDFVDCPMVGYARERNYSVFTFYKQLHKHVK